MYGRRYENNGDNRDCDRDSRDNRGYMNHGCRNEGQEHQCRHNHEYMNRDNREYMNHGCRNEEHQCRHNHEEHHHECNRW